MKLTASVSVPVALLFVSLFACTTPQPPAQLPSTPYVAVLSGQMPPPIDRVARHAWIVVQRQDGPPHRHEYGSSGGPDPFDDFAAGDVMLHGVVAGTDAEIAAIDACLERAHSAFFEDHPDYFPIPGPNSNTYVARLIRDCSLMIELPATAIGRDYVGPVGADVTEAGTGIQIGSIPFGLRIGAREGVGIQIFGLPLGIHFWPPGIEVPINPGRIGFATDAHIERAPNGSNTEPFPDEIARAGAGSVELYALAMKVLHPEEVRGVEGQGVLGVSARAVYGKYVGYGAGLDLEMGIAIPAALAGRAHLFPVGLGVFVSQTGFLALFAGLGASGITDRMPSGLELPVEARFEIDAGPVARFGFFAREAFSFLEPRRTRGLLDLGELSIGCRARLGEAWGFDRGSYGSGYFFAFERREMGRDAMLGFAFGTEIDAGYSPK
ncbi:MAG: DUF3750 domain-containing protein [Polyangiaceae bacterium]|nr:DUF3750 domain-containing protein [Polyangiaceae bacterium]